MNHTEFNPYLTLVSVLAALIAVFATATGTGVFTAYTNRPVVAVIDYAAVLRDAKAAKSLGIQLNTKQQELKKGLLDHNAPEIARKTEEKNQQEMLKKELAEGVNTINQHIRSVAKQLAERNGYAAVVSVEQVFYVPASADITKLVLDKLDADMPEYVTPSSAADILAPEKPVESPAEAPAP